MHHEPSWVTAAPLWQDALAERTRMRKPAILRFASDTFMEELYELLESRAGELAEHNALPAKGASSLKLFQPVHGHFHLIAASLVCGLPGLPDHGLERAREKVGFVLRRKFGNREHAWLPGADAHSPGTWLELADAESMALREELLPLFAAGFQQDGAARKLWLGLVPAASRDTARPRVVSSEAELTFDGDTVLATSQNAADALVPKLGARGDATFVLRCMYQRTGCMPPHAPRLSEPSEEFALASYFDADAPTRNIRIALPSFKDFANLKKGLGFTLPSELRNKLARITPNIFKEETASEGTFDLGEICSFSIPIVTLVAMILLMVIVGLLNIVFFWIPLVKLCLPLPLKARSE
jgi:hypothetical protein